LRLGVKGLDDVIRDFPDSGLVIIAGGPGIGKSVLAGQFIYRGVVDYGERGVYVSFSETKAAFYASMASLGMDFEKLEREGLFHFLNFFISRKEDFSLSLDSLLESISKFNARRVVCDSISVIPPAKRVRNKKAHPGFKGLSCQHERPLRPRMRDIQRG